MFWISWISQIQLNLELLIALKGRGERYYRFFKISLINKILLTKSKKMLINKNVYSCSIGTFCDLK